MIALLTKAAAQRLGGHSCTFKNEVSVLLWINNGVQFQNGGGELSDKSLQAKRTVTVHEMVRPGYNDSGNKKVMTLLLCCVVVTSCADRRVLSQLRSHQQSGDADNALAGRSWCAVTSSGKRPALQ